jgi:hypothetical protein
VKNKLWIGALLGALALVTVTNLEAFNPWAEPPPSEAEIEADAQHLLDDVIVLLPGVGRGESEVVRSYAAACNKSWTIVSWNREVRIDYDATADLGDLQRDAASSLRAANWHVREYQSDAERASLGVAREPGDTATTVTVIFEPASDVAPQSITARHIGPCVKVDPSK